MESLVRRRPDDDDDDGEHEPCERLSGAHVRFWGGDTARQHHLLGLRDLVFDQPCLFLGIYRERLGFNPILLGHFKRKEIEHSS